MKKIVLMNIPMQEIKPIKCHYPVYENKRAEFEGETVFGINSTIAKKLSADDEVTFILIKVKDAKGISEKNTEIFKEDFESVNKVGAKVDYVEIDTDLKETKQEFQKIYSKVINKFKEFEEGTPLYAELTFGTKPSSILEFSLIQFGEKCLNFDVKNCIYVGKDFSRPDTPMTIYEVNFLVYLNTLVNTMEVSGNKAVEVMDKFFGL